MDDYIKFQLQSIRMQQIKVYIVFTTLLKPETRKAWVWSSIFTFIISSFLSLKISVT
jgi:hypothetical protein